MTSSNSQSGPTDVQGRLQRLQHWLPNARTSISHSPRVVDAPCSWGQRGPTWGATWAWGVAVVGVGVGSVTAPSWVGAPSSLLLSVAVVARRGCSSGDSSTPPSPVREPSHASATRPFCHAQASRTCYLHQVRLCTTDNAQFRSDCYTNYTDRPGSSIGMNNAR